MELGYPRDGEAMEQIIGQLGANPQAALERLIAVKRDTQRAFAS